MQEQQLQMLRRIMELEFICLELQLFLDTHPDETRAVQDFSAVSAELMEAKSQYEAMYGPLLSYGFGKASGQRWQWIDDLWPWEINWRRSV